MSGPAGLDVRAVRRIHGGLALDVALRLGAECGVVFGPSGAGKTSLLRLIAGLDRPDSGHVRLDGRPLFDADRRIDRPLRDRRVGMIFQDDLLFPHLAARGNIAFGLAGRPRGEAEARLAEVAGLCGVLHLLDRPPATLSGGERQRVGLARALAPRPHLLLCDEPVSALDLDARFALIERLRAVQRAEAIPVLYVTHSPAEAVALGARLFLLEGGRIVAEGDPLETLARRRPGPAEGLRNVVAGRVAGHDPAGGETLIRLGEAGEDGPMLVIPSVDRPIGSALAVAVRSDDILLARGPLAGLSARNRIEGVVERVVARGPEAEAVVRTGPVRWIVGVVASAVAALELQPGTRVQVVIKARSCHPLEGADPA